jgi:hypothetical protein
MESVFALELLLIAMPLWMILIALIKIALELKNKQNK